MAQCHRCPAHEGTLRLGRCCRRHPLAFSTRDLFLVWYDLELPSLPHVQQRCTRGLRIKCFSPDLNTFCSLERDAPFLKQLPLPTYKINFQTSQLWRRAWQPTPAFLPGESHGQRSLVGYSTRGCKESDTTEQLTHSRTPPYPPPLPTPSTTSSSFFDPHNGPDDVHSQEP